MLTEVTLTADSEGRDVRCQFKSDKRSSSEAGGIRTGWLTLVRSLSHIRGLTSGVSRVFTDEGCSLSKLRQVH